MTAVWGDRGGSLGTAPSSRWAETIAWAREHGQRAACSSSLVVEGELRGRGWDAYSSPHIWWPCLAFMPTVAATHMGFSQSICRGYDVHIRTRVHADMSVQTSAIFFVFLRVDRCAMCTPARPPGRCPSPPPPPPPPKNPNNRRHVKSVIVSGHS